MSLHQQTTRVLIIDDDEDDFLITSDYIKSINEGKFVIEWCYKYAEALEKIARRDYDIYFVDYRLGAKTPRSNCVLDVSKLLAAGVRLRPVEEAVEDALRRWRSA